LAVVWRPRIASRVDCAARKYVANEQRAASAERQQIATARDLAALRQTVEQLAAGQKQLTRDIAKLQAEKPRADNPKSSSPRIISSISPRTRSRIPLSMGSNQSSKRWELISVVEGESSGVVVTLAW
jgi:hypothetical protein